MISRSSALSAAALTILVGVPAALAATLPGGARYAGKTGNGSAVMLRLSGDSARVARMRIHYTLHCVDANTGAKSTGKSFTDILNPPLRSDGSFKGAGTYKGSSDNSTNKFTVAGRVTTRTSSGTFALTAVATAQPSGDTVNCKTGTLHWRAARAH
jgi:hypothetical protein